ncbi:RNA polymerase sigma factor SigJ [Stutzerimonas degradans]|uniref:RNA polymerase subunit sigma-24 n=1 Tax=Stutzerimonas degradans TaxID=2968968 RepID=A0A8E2QFF3_9GAMM|nr:RNA polymerase sigma factor SigJ [Stutzerimonas degradans]MCQ4274252.1 RNA polymerase sigma factor SigJ [Stutzerimonas degradans]PNF77074.1 RNA polymerase subunit sigma-24 [Stutzerimonas degradans]QPT21376.1 RNA polymerase sigma factor SigJ [Stutzerimonas degradans]
MRDKTDFFQTLRPKLFGLAYRLLGSRADAEDLLQDAWLKWSGADAATIRDAEAWLVTVVTRLGIDQLRQRRARREEYLGPWLPEPLLGLGDHEGERLADLGADISMAFMVLLERLGAEERAALLLREVLEHSYEQIAATLGKNAAACRQIISRARRRVREERPRFAVDGEAHRRLVERFAATLLEADSTAFAELLAEDVSWMADGGGLVSAASKTLHGVRASTRLARGIARRAAGQWQARVAWINGEPGVLVLHGEHLHAAMTLVSDGRQIRRIYAVLNPHKLGQTSPDAAT